MQFDLGVGLPLIYKSYWVPVYIADVFHGVQTDFSTFLYDCDFFYCFQPVFLCDDLKHVLLYVLLSGIFILSDAVRSVRLERQNKYIVFSY